MLCATLGFAFDAGSGNGNLTRVFASLYVIGCLAAVLSVRRSGLFTAVVQPPLILFAVVPGAYFLMHSSDIHGVKDLLINCGYPLIERFPLMFFTSAAVLLLGLARWYLGRSDTSDTSAAEGSAAAGPALLAKLTAMVTSRLESKPATDGPRRRRADQRRAATTSGSAGPRGERSPRSAASVKGSRRTRSADPDAVDSVGDRPRRRRPRAEDLPPTAEPRRRRPAGERRRRHGGEPPKRHGGEPPKRRRGEPTGERDGVPPRRRGEQPRRRGEPAEQRRSMPSGERERRYRERTDRDRPQRARPERDARYDGYDLFGGYESPPSPSGPRPDGNHHPVSRVRYRGADDADDDRSPRRRAPRGHDADRWNYDI